MQVCPIASKCIYEERERKEGGERERGEEDERP